MTSGLYIGLMSGTSVDSVDAALLHIDSHEFELLGTASVQYDADLRLALLALKSTPHTSLASLVELDHRVATAFATAATCVMQRYNVSSDEISAIGSHGQTIFHLPDSRFAGTLQIGDPNLIAALTQVDVVADFRRADMAAGGQGAPLAPAFHQFVLGSTGDIVLNLGGIANITVLNQETIGFDTGPANAILDECTQHFQSKAFDEHGLWARSGSVDQKLLQAMLADPYFAKAPPKSTGTDYFNLAWAMERCDNPDISSQDLQRTLLELTAVTVARDIDRFARSAKVLVCGGGLKNTFLMERLSASLPETSIQPLDSRGINSEACECCAFAWLAYRFKNNLPGNLPQVTGASRRVVLGAMYPAQQADCAGDFTQKKMNHSHR